MTLDGFTDGTALLRAGVYALTWRNTVVYVGQSKHLLRRLHDHRSNSTRNRKLYAWEPRSNKMQFDGMHFTAVAPDRLDEVEREMIARYRPRYNVCLKPSREVPMIAPIDLDFDGAAFIINQPAPVLGLVRRA